MSKSKIIALVILGVIAVTVDVYGIVAYTGYGYIWRDAFSFKAPSAPVQPATEDTSAPPPSSAPDNATDQNTDSGSDGSDVLGQLVGTTWKSSFQEYDYSKGTLTLVFKPNHEIRVIRLGADLPNDDFDTTLTAISEGNNFFVYIKDKTDIRSRPYRYGILGNYSDGIMEVAYTESPSGSDDSQILKHNVTSEFESFQLTKTN